MAEENVTEVTGEKSIEAQRKTLFIRNLPYNATDKELENLFSEFGPIKRSFVVKDKDASKGCRGFGYVTYALPEDAAKALQAGVTLNGRKVIVSVADKKPRQRDNYKPKNKQDTGDAAEVSELVNTEDVDIAAKTAAKKRLQLKSDDPLEEIKRTILISGLPNTATKSKLKQLCSKFGKVKKIQYPAPDRDDTNAIIIYKSIKSAVRSFQKLNGSKFEDKFVNACLIAKEGKKPLRKDLDKSKLIVRNVAFKCKEEDLKSAFGKCGDVINIELPTKTDGKGRTLMRGFAFVQFSNQEHAKSAMEELNKKMIKGRPIIIDWAVPKDKFVANNEDQMKHKNKQEGQLVNENVENEEEEEEEESDKEDEVIESESDDKEQQEELDSDAEESENDSAESDEDSASNIPKIAKKQSYDVKEGRTAFIRNLPFEATEEDLRESFCKYGQIEYCKVVFDPETGHSRGSGFIKFKEPSIVDSVISDSENPADARNGGIFMEGRRLVVMKAVTRGKVKEIEKQTKEAKKDQKDKRNLSLAQEGVIFPDSEAAKEMSEADMKKREKARTEKKAKLKNQNYFVSRTRLCVRNLPLNIGELELKKSFLTVVNKKDVKMGKVRIMRSKERLDKEGKGRSLGYAFVEFESHEQALATLRATNNNADIFGDARRPIVEFSVENKVALDLQEKRRERQSQKAENWGGQQRDKGGKDNGVEAQRKERKSTQKGKGGMDSRDKNKMNSRKRSSNEATRPQSENVEKDAAVKRTKVEGSKPEKKFRKERIAVSKPKEGSIKSNDKRRTFAVDKKRKNVNAATKRKMQQEVDDTVKPSKMKKLKKKRKPDKEEDNFNSLVSKYKEKLFGDSANKKKDEKRWFE